MVGGQLPIIFRKSGAYVASYDWVDATTGCGYRRYYACASDQGGEGAQDVKYYLTPKVLDSMPWFRKRQVDTSGIEANRLKHDVDFDIIMKLPAIASGIAFVNISHALTEQGSIDKVYMVVNIYHVTTGAVETSIGTASTWYRTGGATPPYYWRENLKITLTEKAFSAGESLRLNIMIYAWDNTGGYTIFYHDPSERVTGYTGPNGEPVSTDLIFDCPFKIDI